VMQLAVAALLMMLVSWICKATVPSAADWQAVLHHGRGALLGLAAAGTMLALLGWSWGTTWLELVPTPRRLVAAGFLFVPVLLCSLGLAVGMQWLISAAGGTWRAAALRGAAWLGLSSALWLSHVLLMGSDRQLLAIPGLLVTVSGVVALPLWLLQGRPGLGAARAVCHAVAVACVLAWHLPFVE
jgi:hypothetical protein